MNARPQQIIIGLRQSEKTASLLPIFILPVGLWGQPSGGARAFAARGKRLCYHPL